MWYLLHCKMNEVDRLVYDTHCCLEDDFSSIGISCTNT